MEIQHLNLGENSVPHYVHKIRGDGQCMFYCVSYVVYGSEILGYEVRQEIVNHVVNNWEDFHIFVDNYESSFQYSEHMSRADTYGTTCELIAAGQLYKYRFEVYIGNNLIAQFGDPMQGVGRLMFSGNWRAGHFDCLIPVQQTESIIKKNHTKKRRSRFSDSIRRKQIKSSSMRYQKKHPDVNRRAVAKYTLEHPEVNRQAVDKYTLEHPEVHRQAVHKYTLEHPEVNRQAVHKYAQKKLDYEKCKWSSKYRSAFAYNRNIEYELDPSTTIGKMIIVCKWCNAKKWKDESIGLCCSSGKVVLPPLQKPPEPLYSLIRKEHPDSPHFLQLIRKYNSSFQMTSFGAKELREGNFMPTFKIQGQVYHLIGSLLPVPQQEPKFLQIYFVGNEDDEANIRCTFNTSLKKGLILELQSMLHNTNTYVKELRAAIDNIAEKEDFEVVIHSERKPVGEHKGRYNAPAVNEVAVVIVGQEFEQRDIVLRSRDNKLHKISEIHRAYDTLQYPLMFCYGEDGYTINISQLDGLNKKAIQKTVSAAQFYTYRIMERERENNHLLLFRNLFNQYLVDMYAKIETERLQFIRKNQKKLRVENYVHLLDAIHKKDASVIDTGKMVLLPSTFTGGPRYLHERTQDAMTYVRHYGKPNLFITFTCNPKWMEISGHLAFGQKAYHRHDLIARVFHLKVKKLINLLTKGNIFGEARCHMFTVEWQKRGLPHVHILLWLKECISANEIDKIISAEIPSRDEDIALYEIVKSNMIHGPCGALNKNSPCMVNGHCSKHYPRNLLKQTQTGQDGYPQYRRRAVQDGGFTVNINGLILDNRWVVPYSPVLSRTFNAHINVEFCNSVKSIKYICKYINKGSDQASFAVKNDFDEVAAYETGRYISSSEAAWRIFCFPIHERYPPVMHLSVHLENGQRVYFTEDNVMEKIQNPPKTTLMGFFNLCRVDDFAKQLLYHEVPEYFVWKNGSFCRRKKGEPVAYFPGVRKEHILGRVYTVHPNNLECYYLRLLLHEVRGPTSFQDIKTINGILHETFQSACAALGLLEDDEHWNRTLQDAVVSESAHNLRQLFAIMLVFCNLSQPVALWEKHKDDFSEDITSKLQMKMPFVNIDVMKNEIYNECLILLDDFVLTMSAKSLKDFGLPVPLRSASIVTGHDYLMERSYNVREVTDIVLKNEPLLNNDQKKVYSKVFESTQLECGNTFFLDAPGRTGKTFLINLLLCKVRAQHCIAIAVASSGIAATLLYNGRTAHSTFKLPLNFNFVEQPVCNISKQSAMARLLRDCKLIVWDECTMSNKRAIEALDRTLQDIRRCNSVMGGLTVLLSGDFRQTLPVVPRGTRADEVNACLKSSYLWQKLKVLTLRTNMRLQMTGDLDTKRFAHLLLTLGEGKLEENNGKIDIPTGLCNLMKDIQSLTDMIYPDLQKIHDRPLSWFRERVIMTAKNDRALEINDLLLEKFDGTLKKYKSIDSVVEIEDAVHYPVEFLNSLNPPGIPPHLLNLKVGAPVMLLRNIKPPELCNGTRLQITALFDNVVEATIFTGPASGEKVLIPRIPLIPSNYPFEFKRLQFPLKVCFAITINKSQGQTLKVAGVDLREDCFSHGQLYVACSRVSAKENLFILQPEGTTANVVYQEVL